MQLVLLSGGSGKRLWPLSNNARSKQFLPLLEKEDGSMESMVQRVVRQALEANLTNDIILATNVSQLDITTDSFSDTRARYSEFPKISFDYEVAEKAQSVAVVPFAGKWKDLGTWNTLTDELKQPVIGNAVMGPKCENTHIINELQNPIFVDGLKDVVVAACPDGILVCAKKETENIKKYVENLTPRPMYEERRWGTYRVLDDTVYPDGHHALTKSITLRPGKNISYQIHHHRAETWTFTQGEGIFVLDGVEQRVKVGDTVHIPVEHYHAIRALTELTFIEVQCGNPLIEEDIERFEYRWGE